MRIVVALMTAVALLGSATVAYAGPRTRVLGPSGPAHMASSAEGRCAFIWPDHLGSCSSQDPAVKVESQSQGDTSACTFDGTVYWDDGSKPEKFHFNGGPDGTIFNFADHTYKKQGTYTISVSDEVLSGPCSWGDFTVSFTFGPVAECIFMWPNDLQGCASADPAVKVGSQSQGDTSACTFGGTARWDDGSKPEKFHFNGGPDGTIFNFADHAYHKRGTYEIAVSDEVLSGPCSWRDFTVSFTYSGPPCSHEAPASKRIVCIVKMILDGYAYEGWAGGSIPYSWGGGHRKDSPGPSLGTCGKSYQGPRPCKADKTVGLDCSGLTRWVYYLAYGKDVLGAGNNGHQHALSSLRKVKTPEPGDLVFFYSRKKHRFTHVGIYIGHDHMIDEPQTNLFVEDDPVNRPGGIHFVGPIEYERYTG